MSHPTRRAFVLGGGVAGITAAFRLLDRGHEVELIEQHRWLGGRAFSVEDERMGGLRDNGPHVILGCYDAMRWMLRRIGSEDDFERCRTLRLAYVERGGRRFRLELSRLPVPLAMPLALLGLDGLGPGEKVRVLRGLLSAVRRAPASWSLEEWLVDRMQQGRPRYLLWDPLCRAIMNAEAHQVSAEHFLSCLRVAFGGRASRAAIWLPRRPWLEVIGRPAARQLAAEGARLTLGTRVTALHRDGMEGREGRGRITAVELGDGSRRELGPADILVSAMPWHALPGLLSADLGDLQQPGMQLEASPILSVYFDAGEQDPFPDQELLTCMVDGSPFHYVYRTPGDPPGRFALLAAGSRVLEARPADRIEAMAREQLEAFYPGVSLPADTRVRIAKEARATFLASPAAARGRLRPGPLPGAANLLVCGEWTASGLPSTMEGAARSARLAVP